MIEDKIRTEVERRSTERTKFTVQVVNLRNYDFTVGVGVEATHREKHTFTMQQEFLANTAASVIAEAVCSMMLAKALWLDATDRTASD